VDSSSRGQEIQQMSVFYRRIFKYAWYHWRSLLHQLGRRTDAHICCFHLERWQLDRIHGNRVRRVLRDSYPSRIPWKFSHTNSCQITKRVCICQLCNHHCYIRSIARFNPQRRTKQCSIYFRRMEQYLRMGGRICVYPRYFPLIFF
jgi:hypothetical protein